MTVPPPFSDERVQRQPPFQSRPHRQARRRSHRHQGRDRRHHRFLHDLESGAGADHQDAVAEWHFAGQQCMADDLVDGVVTADVFAQAEELAAEVEERRGVEAAGGVEEALVAAHALRQAGEEFEGQMTRLEIGDLLIHVLDAGLAAEPASGGGGEVAAGFLDPLVGAAGGVGQAHHDQVVGVVGQGIPARLDGREIVPAGDDPFGEQESRRQLAVVARRPHGDHQRLAADADLERLFDHHPIVLDPAAALDPHPAEADGGLRARGPIGRLSGHVGGSLAAGCNPPVQLEQSTRDMRRTNMASQSLEALFLRTRDQYAASGRRAHLAVLALLLIHLVMVTPWVERQLARSSDEAEQQRFGALPEIAVLGSALQEVTGQARSTLEPALEQLAEDLAGDLARLDATVRRLAAAADDGGSEAESSPELRAAEIDPRDLPFKIQDAERLAAIRDAVADGAPGSSGSRYGLLAALDPVVEEEIAQPRFGEIQRAWKAGVLPEVEARLGTAAGALPGLRLRFPEAKTEWGALEGALSGLRATLRDVEIEPPSEPFWWASPETARQLEIGIPPATAEKIRHPLALDELLTAAEQTRARYDELSERLERERERTLAASEARSRTDQGFAGLLAELGVDLGAVVTLFPLLLGIVLAAVLVRRNQQLRDLGVATRLTIEEGGSLALRDWCLAQLAGRLSDERTADEAWRAGWSRALGVLGLAFAWIAAAALQVRRLDGIDDRRWLLVSLLGAAAVLAATIHRLVTARGLIGLFVAGVSDPIGPSFGETPVPAVDPDSETPESDPDLDAHTLR